MKYSFIVPVYNGEKYIDRCLSSILKQDYDNYEIIIINDGSTDNSLKILNIYKEKYKQIKLYSTKNNGLSNARNLGITKVSGDYIIFVDIDDYINEEMLSYINKQLEDNENIDLIKFNYMKVYRDYNTNNDIKKDSKILNGCDAFIILVNNKIPFELACIYAYKTSFWNANNFQFEPNKYHEDFGLIPFIIIRTKKILMLDKILYYYYQSENSITRHINIQKQVKQMEDILYHFDNLYRKVNDDNLLSNYNLKIFNSYIANAVLLKYISLNKKNQLRYRKNMIERKIISLLMSDNFVRKLKQTFYKHFYKI